MAKKYIVTLTDEDQAQLHALTKRGTVSARRLTRAHRLLQADAGLSDEAIAQALHIGTATVERIRKRFVEEGVDVHFPQATVISVVVDNLNTHTPAALYSTFPPAEACRILCKLDFHDTPKHGSGLNMAEIEFAVVSTQCLDRRLGDQETVRHAIAAWETRRNAARALVDWRFTTPKARRKLKHIYPL